MYLDDQMFIVSMSSRNFGNAMLAALHAVVGRKDSAHSYFLFGTPATA
jgi:hypothetical protein